ncbi:hypothetical protein E4582_08785 [Luteimonas yindakuii]|uniref:Lipoprotein with Yx(FWY)xxD motif n=1 Tax=Luteimonas yindakuii TaxID=2565782 RepID=A0A4Z1R8C4_9GAMM|nr:hypothetical protein [Luteimonas yindakuii]TKS54845.1 hypothetical protein E4582_08785 [Luteimonas yindakuii]
MSACLKSGSVLALLFLLTACQDRAPEDGASPGSQRAGAAADTATPAGTAPTAEAPAAGQGGTQDRSLLSIAGDGTGPGYLTDGAGQALYVLDGNVGGDRCDAACEEAWPPVLADGATPRADPRIGSGGAGTLPRNDGTRHVTYEGQPLYRYAADAGAGRTAGDGVEDQWGRWSLVRVDGAPAGNN